MEENRRPEVLTVPIAPGVYQNIERRDPLEEVLTVEEFLKLIKPETLRKVVAELESLYKDERKCDYPILPQFLTVIYMKLCKTKNLSALHRKLIAGVRSLAEALGFLRKEGHVEVPCYNNFWNFLKVRVGEDKIDRLSDIVLTELNTELRIRGVELGKNVGHDGFVIRAHDKDAEYNGHYKTTMYKGEVGFDLDLMIPFYGCAAKGTAYDGDYVIPFVEKLDRIEKKERSLYLDGHYTSLRNFAVLNNIHKARTVMNIPQVQRIISEEGNQENIDKWYQSFYEKDDFVVYADNDYKLSFLMKYGRVDEVGYHYRNKYVQEYIDNQDAYEKEYHTRSLEESGNNLIKNGLVDTENASNGTGLRNRSLHVKMCFLAMQLVALIRAQHGRIDGLTSIENLAC